MKLVLTQAEVIRIVVEDLKRRGHKVKESTVKYETHVEGDYDDKQEMVDGISVELEEQQ